jgi:hypothetical protein
VEAELGKYYNRHQKIMAGTACLGLFSFSASLRLRGENGLHRSG